MEGANGELFIYLRIPWEKGLIQKYFPKYKRKGDITEMSQGIYKITNLINGKSYVGQSNNIQRRFSEHTYKGYGSDIPVDWAISKYGKENFSFEILEECEQCQLNEKETHYITTLNTLAPNGYNMNIGGDYGSRGENNGRARLTEQDVVLIRTAYNDHKKQKEVYYENNFDKKISFAQFQAVWQGRSWSYIMPEVFTEENKRYYIYEQSRGNKGTVGVYTDDEVMEFRERYVNETAKDIYYSDERARKATYATLQRVLCGDCYKHLPYYKKKEKRWVEP